MGFPLMFILIVDTNLWYIMYLSFDVCCTYSTQTAAYLLVELCQLPAEGGDCRAHMPRWYYDAKKKRCESFVYGGCGGNANKFISREECVKICMTPYE